MSRSGYSDDTFDTWALIRWRGAVNSAVQGKRGQAFLRELLATLDALPEKMLIEEDLERDGSYCALGAVGAARGMDLSSIPAHDTERAAKEFGIAEAMIKEIVFENDDDFCYRNESPEKRFERVRAWVVSQIKDQEGRSDAQN